MFSKAFRGRSYSKRCYCGYGKKQDNAYNGCNATMVQFPIQLFELLFFGCSGYATSFAKEKEQKTLPELVSCASNSVLAGLGKLLFYWVIALIIMVSVYYITFKVYAIPMRGKPGDIIALGIPFIIASLGIGMCIGLLCKNQINAMHWTMLLTYPCYLISGYAWPHSLMPDFLVKLSQVVPITHIAEHTRDIALLGHGFSYIKQDLLILSAMAVAATVIGLLLFVWQSKKKGGEATC